MAVSGTFCCGAAGCEKSAAGYSDNYDRHSNGNFGSPAGYFSRGDPPGGDAGDYLAQSPIGDCRAKPGGYCFDATVAGGSAVFVDSAARSLDFGEWRFSELAADDDALGRVSPGRLNSYT